MSYGFLRVMQQRQHRLHDASRRLGILSRWSKVTRARREVSAIELVGPVDEVQPHAAMTGYFFEKLKCFSIFSFTAFK